MTAPTISVIVPSYNAASFIPGCIRSIEEQNVHVEEIILVDDGSTDDTSEIVAEMTGVRYVAQSNQGPSSARNKGLDLARGDYVAFLDVDDRWPSGALSALLKYVGTTPGPEVILGKVQCMVQTDNTDYDPSFAPFGEPFVAFNLGAALYAREVFDRVGKFDESLREGEDVDWFLRAREEGVAIHYAEETTLFYRRRQGSITYGRQHHAETLAKMLKKSLDRRRAAHSASEDLPTNITSTRAGDEPDTKE